MPVKPEIAERYGALDANPADLTWEAIDAWASELEREYGDTSLEYAHALALVRAPVALEGGRAGARPRSHRQSARDRRPDLRPEN
ncbi:MAG TPA: hypothetical protein VF647_13590 [Longimicrobium sp.]|jgi:hypothetical protein